MNPQIDYAAELAASRLRQDAKRDATLLDSRARRVLMYAPPGATEADLHATAHSELPEDRFTEAVREAVVQRALAIQIEECGERINPEAVAVVRPIEHLEEALAPKKRRRQQPADHVEDVISTLPDDEEDPMARPTMEVLESRRAWLARALAANPNADAVALRTDMEAAFGCAVAARSFEEFYLRPAREIAAVGPQAPAVPSPDSPGTDTAPVVESEAEGGAPHAEPVESEAAGIPEPRIVHVHAAPSLPHENPLARELADVRAEAASLRNTYESGDSVRVRLDPDGESATVICVIPELVPSTAYRLMAIISGALADTLSRKEAA